MIVLSSTGYGVHPPFGYVEDLEHAIIRSSRDDWNVRARALNPYAIERFDITHDSLTEGQLVLLEIAWEDSRAGVLPMLFTRPRDADVDAIPVVFKEGRLAYRKVGPREWSTNYRIERSL